MARNHAHLKALATAAADAVEDAPAGLQAGAVPAAAALVQSAAAVARVRPRSAAAHSAAGASGAAAAPRAAPSGSTHRIVESITEAIIERRLMPGTKLAEQHIADLFKVSRTVVRQALNQLSRDRLITLSPARGAFVAEPSIEEARQVFQVRQMIEASMVKQLCARVTPAQVAQLRLHLSHESQALQRVDVAGRTRLLADFHVTLARMLGNEVLAQLLADLLARCSLIALMYQSSHSAVHSASEHVAIVDAIERHDGRAAARLMEAHLGNVECSLQMQPRASDLAAALRMTSP